jgi:ADP-ribose pyrophosphatase YjhB (NUDIX family)
MDAMTARRPFQFCPFCATPLQLRPFGPKTLPTCGACGFIQHPDPKVAVTARIEHAGHLLLARRGVNPGRGLWALPGGYLDAGELPEVALHREIREELDLAITVHELLATYSLVTAAGGPSPGFVMVFRATLADRDHPLAAPLCALDDVAEARWFTPSELAAAVADEKAGELAFASTTVEVRRWLAQLAQNWAEIVKESPK